MEITETLCDMCEQAFDRSDLEYVILRSDPQGYERPHDPKPFYACNPCAVKEKLNFYHSRWIESAQNQQRLLAENNLFRTMMMGNDAILAMSNESEVSIRSYMVQHKTRWNALPLDSMHMFLQLMSAHAETFASLMNEKASKEEIQAHLVSKTDAQKVKHKASLDIKREIDTGLKGSYTKDEAKAVKSMMKQLRCNETQAYAYIVGVMKTSMKMSDDTK